MSRYLYLVRHGEQVDAEFGLPDGPLSDRGREQADRIADRLGSISFDAAYTSPLQRAIERQRSSRSAWACSLRPPVHC